MRCRGVDGLPAQPGAAHDAVERAALVGRLRVAVAELLAAHGEGVVRREGDEVGVGADGEAALLRQAGEVGGALGHPPREVGERDLAFAGRRSTRPQGKLDRRDTAPGRGEIAGVLEGPRAGEWSVTTMLSTPLRSPAQSAAWWWRSRIGGKHFTDGSPSGSSSAQRARVVGARLGGHADAAALGELDGRDALGGGDVDDVHVRARLLGEVGESADRHRFHERRPGASRSA